MHRPAIASLAAMLVLAAPAPAHAIACRQDDVPAATLLIPYIGLPAAPCTNDRNAPRAHVTNTSAADVAIAITYFSNTGTPVKRTAQTLAAGATATIELAPALCGDAVARDRLLGVDAGGQCHALPPRTAGFIEAYATIDVVSSTTNLPAIDDLAYYAPPHLSNANVLTGTWRFPAGFSFFDFGTTSFPAVAIEALPGAFDGGEVTFYGRYNGATAVDAREPLATAYSAPYENGGTSDISPRAIAWRETDGSLAPFACATGPAWPPLGHRNGRGTGRGVVLVDSQGVGYGPLSSPGPFTRATQLVPLRSVYDGPSGGSGTLIGNFIANFQHAFTAYGDARFGQAWLGLAIAEQGQSLRGIPGTPLDSGCTQGANDYAAPARDTGAP